MRMRMKCSKCGTEYWNDPSASIHRLDHVRPDNRNCSAARTYYRGVEMRPSEAKRLYERGE